MTVPTRETCKRSLLVLVLLLTIAASCGSRRPSTEHQRPHLVNPVPDHTTLINDPGGPGPPELRTRPYTKQSEVWPQSIMGTELSRTNFDSHFRYPKPDEPKRTQPNLRRELLSKSDESTSTNSRGLAEWANTTWQWRTNTLVVDHPERRIQNLEFRTRNPEPRTPNPELRTQNLKLRILYPELGTHNQTHNPEPEPSHECDTDCRNGAPSLNKKPPYNIERVTRKLKIKKRKTRMQKTTEKSNKTPARLKTPIQQLLFILFLSQLPTANATEITLASLNIGDGSKLCFAVTSIIAALSPTIIFTQEDWLSKSTFEFYAKTVNGFHAIGHHRTRKQAIAKKLKSRTKDLSEKFKVDTNLESLVSNRNIRNRRGSAIWIKDEWKERIIGVRRDSKFRVIWVGLELNKGQALIITNVYGENKREKKERFWKEVEEGTLKFKSELEKSYATVSLIIGGDFNITPNPALDRRKEGEPKISEENNNPNEILENFKESLNLWDTFRERNGDKKFFTYFAKPSDVSKSKKTRIDLWLTDELYNVTSSWIRAFEPTWSKDHAMVGMKIQLDDGCEATVEERNSNVRPKFITAGLDTTQLKAKLQDVGSERLNEIYQRTEDVVWNQGRIEREEFLILYEEFISELKKELEKVLGVRTQTQARRGNPMREKSINKRVKQTRLLKRIKRVCSKRNEVGDQLKLDELVQKYNEASGEDRKLVPERDKKETLQETIVRLSQVNESISKRVRKTLQRWREKIITKCKEKRDTVKGLYMSLKSRNRTVVKKRIVQFKVPENEDRHTSETATLENSKEGGKLGGERREVTNLDDIIEEHTKMWQSIFSERVSEAEAKAKGTHLTKHPKGIDRKMENPTKQDFLGEIVSGKIGKAAGTDMITNEIWKCLPLKQQLTLAHLMMIAWKREWIPEPWKESLVVLIPKNEETEYLTNFRPIALCQCAYKFFTRVLLKKMSEHIEKNQLLNTLQFGAKKDASITQAILLYLAIIDDAIATKRDLFVLSLDLVKAYDSVTFHILEKTLIFYKFPKKTIDLVRKLYKDNVGDLHTPLGKAKNKLNFKSGLKQGCGLSPLLWVIFLNPVLEELSRTGKGYKLKTRPDIAISHITFMDDTYLVSDNLEDLQQMANLVLSMLDKMALKINAGKTTLTTNNNKPAKLNLNGKEISANQSPKANRFLGVYISMDLSWEDQYERIIKKVRLEAGRIDRMLLTTKQKTTVINTVLIPSIAYSLNAAYLSEKQEREVDNILTGVVKGASKVNRRINNNRVWLLREKGGWGLKSIRMVNRSQFLSNVLNNGLNTTNEMVKAGINNVLRYNRIDLECETVYQPKSPLGEQLVEARDSSEVKIVKKNPQKTKKAWTYRRVNVRKEDLIEDKVKGDFTLPIWTDGGKENHTERWTCSMVIGSTKQIRDWWYAVKKTSSTAAELEAIREGLTVVARGKRTTIFTDSQAAIEILKKRPSSKKEWERIEEGSTLRDILEILERKKKDNLPEPEIIWVPGHMDDPAKETPAKKNQVEYLANRFAGSGGHNENHNEIVEGNLEADKLTGETPEQVSNVFFMSQSNTYQIESKGIIYETDLRGRISKALMSRTEKERYKLTKGGFNTWDEIEIELSNAHLDMNTFDHLFDWTHKVRTMSLCTGVKGFLIGSEKKNVNMETLFPTPICEHCKEINDYWHLWRCKKTTEIQENCVKEVKNVLEKYGNFSETWTPYWITKADTLKTSSIPCGRINPNRTCVCNLPEHGTYLHCTKCRKNFHPICIGIITPLEKIDVATFQCRECNPADLRYYYDRNNTNTGKREVTREGLICEVLELSSRVNRAKRNQAESMWNKEKLERYQEESKIINTAKRGNMGYIPKSFYSSLKTVGEQAEIDKNVIREDAIKINAIVLEHGMRLYKEHWKHTIEQRQEEGVVTTNLNWNHLRHKAELDTGWDNG